ncbi:MAG: hypothetical protein QXR53_00060 [Candidatus Norongarragalinales archaeon]
MESKQEEKFVLKQAEEELKKKQDEQKHEPAKAEAKDEKKPAKESKAKTEGKKEEKKREVVVERLYTIPLKRFLHDRARMKRYKRHGPTVRAFAAKHFKTGEKNVKIENKVSIALSKAGRNKMLSSLKVKISKDKEGLVLVELAA